MTSRNFILIITLIALAGCEKKEDAPAVPVEPTAVAPSQTGAPKPLAPAPIYIATQAENSIQANVSGEVDAFLTSQLRIFIKTKGRMPESFTEFTRTRLDSVPRAPQGGKWVIDSASSEVKAVKR